MLFNNKKGFSLAEVLITLGIVGVVAAITIPALIQHNKATRLRSQFLKSYSTLQQAFKLMENDDVSLDPSTYQRREFCEKTLTKYLSNATICGNSKNTPCYMINEGKPYKTLSGENLSKLFLDDGQVLLKDGTLLMCEHVAISGNWGTIISIDINGYNTPPNILGYDLFSFQMTNEELRTMGDKNTIHQRETNSLCDINNTHNQNGITCAYKAKNESDYFKKIVKLKI